MKCGVDCISFASLEPLVLLAGWENLKLRCTKVLLRVPLTFIKAYGILITIKLKKKINKMLILNCLVLLIERNKPIYWPSFEQSKYCFAYFVATMFLFIVFLGGKLISINDYTTQ